MKALTICQPYPFLILLPTDDPRHKRVENRDWPTSFRGSLLIHAGKSKSWMDADTLRSYAIKPHELVMGAIVGVADLVECVHIDRVGDVSPEQKERFGWVKDHEHTSGLWCWILEGVKKFQSPIPYRGAQGLFDVPDADVRAQLDAAIFV